jgi:hypothetical protein
VFLPGAQSHFSLESVELRSARFSRFVSRFRVDYKHPVGNSVDLSQRHKKGHEAPDRATSIPWHHVRRYDCDMRDARMTDSGE